ncbi:AraC family transcriptional regulator [Paenibacillus hemerocallicola]|uniref:AraC family transcriptional regulator n=1 Tax=Paenibacillus hemerocallicola TaxID=1172614 RepID=A0A5C4TEX4_9BACL|nr:AraC family transcriptional regulator [Paenibacillus hemerocallicola]TNJ67653.1 AraC family transcriptional regulator [Paenibacillus hemerocallicola]
MNMQTNEHPLVKALYIETIGCTNQMQSLSINRARGSDNYILIYSYEGKGWFQAASREKTTIGKNTAILIQPGNPYSYGSYESEPWSFYFAHIRGENSALYFQGNPAIHMIGLEESHIKCKQLFAECYEIWSDKTSIHNRIYSSHLIGQLLTLLSMFQGVLPNRLPKDKPVNEAIQFMLRHIEGRLTLQQLCKMTNLSKPYLVKLFNKNTGYSPIDYFLRLKIRRACEYFDSTDLTVKEVCFKLGFTDPYYFSRMFSKIMGQSPSKYRYNGNHQ